MFLKMNKKGITGVMDAMIFITIMTIVFAGIYSLNSNSDDEYSSDASQISEQILSSKFSLCDITGSTDTILVSMPDLLAAYVISEDMLTEKYLIELLDAATGLPDSYKMTLHYKGQTASVGNGDGIPMSKCTKDTVVVYGDILTTILEFY